MSNRDINADSPQDPSTNNPNGRAGNWKFASLLGKQEWYWSQKSPISIEDLVHTSTVPLTDDQQLSLICNEVYLRECNGEQPTLEEYQVRFQHLAKDLEIQWQLDHWLCPASEVNDTPGQHNDITWPRSIVTDVAEPIAGRYQVQSKLGSGGMGVVYRAVDARLQRDVALKMLSQAAARDVGLLARFRREAALIASMNSPYVVRVYDTGDSTTGPYIAMEYCRGGSLADLLRTGPLTTRLAAEIARQAASGIEAAHRTSVVHRDLKPGNILLVESSSLSNESVQIKVTDFGLAKRINDIDSATLTGELLGTPAYLAPEQLGANTEVVLPLVDVYALGAILYECLVGRPPIRGATTMETLKLLATQDPVPIRTLQPNVPVDLAVIAHKCLQREPSERYASAQDVCDDLGRFLNGKPILAKPTPSWIRLAKWSKRNPFLSGAIVFSTLVLIASMTIWISFTKELQIAKDHALTESRVASAQRDNAKRNASLAMEAVDNFLSQVADKKLANIPEFTETRKQLLNSALEFCKKLQDSSSDFDPDVANETALAHRRLAKVYRALGENQLWRQEIQLAAEMHRSLVESHPENARYLFEYAVSLNNLSNAEGEFISADKALETLLESIRIKGEVLKLDPRSPEYRSSYASSLYSISPKLRSRDPKKTEEFSIQAENIYNELINEFPENLDYKRSLAGLLRNRAAMLARIGQHSKAEETASRHVDLWRIIAQGQSNTNDEYELLSGLDLHAAIHTYMQSFDLAEPLQLEAFHGLKRLAVGNPSNPGFVQAYMNNVSNRTLVLLQQNRLDEALKNAENPNEISSDAKFANAAGISLPRLTQLKAMIELENALPTDSLNSLELSEKQLAVLPANQTPMDYIQSSVLRGLDLMSLGELEKSVIEFQRKWDELRQWATASPSDIETSRILLLSTANQLVLHIRNQDLEAATTVLQQAEKCGVKGREAEFAILNCLINTAKGDRSQAISVIEQYCFTRAPSTFWPDHIPTLIVKFALQSSSKDSDIDPAKTEQTLKLEELKLRLAEHAVSLGWTSPFRRDWLSKH